MKGLLAVFAAFSFLAGGVAFAGLEEPLQLVATGKSRATSPVAKKNFKM